MLKIFITCFIWIACFLVMLPPGRSTWIGVIAGFASYQVFMYFIYDLYEVALAIVEALAKMQDKDVSKVIDDLKKE